jgi:DNA-binding MarR family transcriptional regulator
MPEIKKALKLTRLEYYETHLSIINCLLPIKMTPKEIEVLAAFMSLNTGDLPATNTRFSSPSRKYVKELLNLSDQGLSNYMNSLSVKGFIYNNGITRILPILIPSDSQQDYRFRLKITENGQNKAEEGEGIQTSSPNTPTTTVST